MNDGGEAEMEEAERRERDPSVCANKDRWLTYLFMTVIS
jgi:hypothetical protein